ncbi:MULTISPECIES: hypothetical protein [Lacrimispora]|uniref:hypothetical protein n=1 Tax=Lacrimispora TaxID=2719231 RepID=UPI000BE31631|nr:hypothetical protein [Lacrimispora amygdalina]MDK2967585.1 hypothetical protein [Lacrimispora sp.]
MANYLSVYGVVNSVTPFQTSVTGQSCSVLLSVTTQSQGQIDFVVSLQTFVLEQHTFRPGEPVIGVYDTSVPVPLIYPPQYQAVVLAPNRDGNMAALDYFDDDLLNSEQTIRLNIPADGSTEILMTNGQYYLYNPGGHYLFFLYASASVNTPAEITPEKIIVFCSPE